MGSFGMKKVIFSFLVIAVFLVLWGCGPDDEEELIIPQFSHLVVEERSPVVDGELEPYIVNKNQVIRVEVHFTNPSNLAINSVTVNGTRFFSNRFEEGTSNQRVVLELNVGQITGEQTFVVDRFAYRVSPEEPSREIEVTDNNRYEIFVLKSLPNLSVNASRVFTNSIEVDVNLIDVDQVAIPESIVATLSRGTTVIETKTLSRGINALVFEGLLSNQEYHLEIIADYDLEDGEGVVEDYVLLSEVSFSTNRVTVPSANIINLDVNENSIEFDMTLVDDFNTIIEDGLRVKLYLDDTLIESKLIDHSSLNDIIFDSLLNNNHYTIQIIADYDLRDVQGLRENRILFEQDVKTLMRSLPEIDVELRTLTDTRLIVGVNAEVLEEAVSLHNLFVSLLAEDGSVLATGTLLEREIVFNVENLLANQTLTLLFEGRIDLDDGQGVKLLEVFREEYQTNELMRPSGQINSIDLRYDEVAFSISFSNPSNTALEDSLVADLYENGEFLERKILNLQGGTYVFENIDVYYDRVYTIKLYVDYDLRDGAGRHKDNFLSSFAKTYARPIQPDIIIEDIIESTTSITIEYSIRDRLNTLSEGGLLLKFNDTEIPLSITETSITLNDLQSNEAFNIEIIAQYFYDDIEHELIVYQRIHRTPMKELPNIQLTGISLQKDAMNFTVNIDDTDDVVTPSSLRLGLYDRDDQRIGQLMTIDELMKVQVYNLWSDYTYTVRIYGDVDFNDGVGLQENQVIFEEELKTQALSLPSPQLSNLEIDGGSLSIDLTGFTDSDEVFTMMAINLYLVTGSSLELLETISVDLENISNPYTFSEVLDLSNEYRVRLYGSYDLRDSFPVREEELFDSITFIYITE